MSGGDEKGLICSYLRGLYIQTIKAGLFQYSKGIKGAKVRRVSVQTQTAGVLERRGQRYYKQAGEGVCNRNGKGRVALKKISVQNPPKRFGLAESFGSQKIFRKNFGKMKKGFVSKGGIIWV